MRAKDLLGRRGEMLAADVLEDRGIRVIDRNWRCPTREIDLVAIDSETLVIAEVKTGWSLRYGHPFESINATKLVRLRTFGVLWWRDHALLLPHTRIDALDVLDDGGPEPDDEHLEGVG